MKLNWKLDLIAQVEDVKCVKQLNIERVCEREMKSQLLFVHLDLGSRESSKINLLKIIFTTDFLSVLRLDSI